MNESFQFHLIRLDYEEVSIQTWMSKKGYFYKVDSISNKTKRISESEYLSYYEEKYDL